ncbi:hypothetical protein LA080_004532 [Diaporthe eres]|nr:hypothetical protein LA080_004532 [Diaporthe eres]
MLPALYIARALNHSSLLLHGQCSVAVKRSDLSSRWFCLTSALRPGWRFHPPLVQQRRFASNKDQRSSNRTKESSNKDKESSNKDKESSRKDEEWYCWYARLGLRPDPNASVKDFRKAFYKRAKLQETFEKLCDESERKEHDQQRLARQKSAAAQMMTSQPSVADILRAKWKAEDEAVRKAEDMRTREARKTAQEDHQSAKPSKKYGTGADSQKPQGSKPEDSKDVPRKEHQQHAKPEETEEDRLRKRKIADDLLAKTKAAAEEKKRRKDAAAEKTRQNNMSQERVIIVGGLPAGTELVDLFEPLIDLAPGPVFDAKLWSARVAAIEFCTDAAARRVLALAQQQRLYIKGTRITTVQLTRSTNKIPAVGSGSRVVMLVGVSGLEPYVKNEKVGNFLTRHGLRVERTGNPLLTPPGSSIIRLASWADADKASRLLAKHLPNLEIKYGPDPCGNRKSFLHVSLGYLLRSLGFSNTERNREETVEITPNHYRQNIEYGK